MANSFKDITQSVLKNNGALTSPIIESIRALETKEDIIKAQKILWQYLEPYYKETQKEYLRLIDDLAKLSKDSKANEN